MRRDMVYKYVYKYNMYSRINTFYYAYVFKWILWFGVFLPWDVRRGYSQAVREINESVSGVIVWIKSGFKKRAVQYTDSDDTELLKRFDDTLENLSGDTEQEVCLMYSGGSDSTLAALMLAEKFSRVHLLTCDLTTHTSSPVKSRKNVARLREEYGADKFLHHFIDVDDLFRKVYLAPLKNDIKQYGLYAQGPCASCKLAMLMGAIDYCRENKIKVLATGNEHTHIVYPFQLEVNLKTIQAFCRAYGVEFMVPIYMLKNSDRLLHLLDIYEFQSTKDNKWLHRAIQARCPYGFFQSIYAQKFFFERAALREFENISEKYVPEKIQKKSLCASV